MLFRSRGVGRIRRSRRKQRNAQSGIGRPAFIGGSTSAAPAVFALRYHLPLLSAICYRTGLARWQIEIGEEIPTRIGGQPRPIEAIAMRRGSGLAVEATIAVEARRT